MHQHLQKKPYNRKLKFSFIPHNSWNETNNFLSLFLTKFKFNFLARFEQNNFVTSRCLNKIDFHSRIRKPYARKLKGNHIFEPIWKCKFADKTVPTWSILFIEGFSYKSGGVHVLFFEFSWFLERFRMKHIGSKKSLK